jgi:hypothetical protein
MMTKELAMIDSISDISDAELRSIEKFGFCYVRIPDEDGIKEGLKRLQTTALNFYRQNPSYKEKFTVNGNIVGYLDRSLENKDSAASKHILQQCFFPPDQPVGPFEENLEDCLLVNKVFTHEIGMPLLRKIFSHLNAPELNDLIDEPFIRFSCPYYDPKLNIPGAIGLRPHKDFGTITILWITKPGLEVWIDSQWHPVDPKEGYFVVNLGNSTELVTGKANSALHRVRMPKDERLSIAIYLHFNLARPILNTRGEQLFATGNDYLKQLYDKFFTGSTISDKLEVSLTIKRNQAARVINIAGVLMSLLTVLLYRLDPTILGFLALLFTITKIANHQIFSYKKKSLIDYLNYQNGPSASFSREQNDAYRAGIQSAESLLEFAQSFFEPATYKHPDIWRAGYVAGESSKIENENFHPEPRKRV